MLHSKPRKRFNRFAKALAELYDVSYHVALDTYTRFAGNMAVCHFALEIISSLVNRAESELDLIDSHNFSF